MTLPYFDRDAAVSEDYAEAAEEVSISEPNPQDVCTPLITSDCKEEAAAINKAVFDPAEVGATYVPDIDPFSLILGELELLHNKKRADYGSSSDPYANVRASSEFGIPPWIGVMVRLNDKVKRIKAAATGSTMQNESIIDSFNDLAVYAIIARLLYEESDSIEAAAREKRQMRDGLASEAAVS